MERQGNERRGRPGWEERGRNGRKIFMEGGGSVLVYPVERLNLGQRVAAVIGRKYFVLEAAWDAVGEDELERERCLRAAGRGKLWLEGDISEERLGALQHAGGQYIHGSFTDEVIEGMKGEDAIIFALEPEGEQMAHAIRVGGAPAVDCGTCRVSTMSRASSRAAEKRVKEGEDADRQLRQESMEAGHDAAGAAADRQLRQESMELDWFSSDMSTLSTLSWTPNVVTSSMIAIPPPPPRASTVERYMAGEDEEFADLDSSSSGGSLTPRRAYAEVVDLITPESTPELQESYAYGVTQLVANTVRIMTQFLDVRSQIEQLEAKA
ncbi:hypothetical protein EV426DRAFT_578781 [Tirmania nivea]|nr:hypothetical protein EV426DRAFT_578781 [Tirmania nivea]